MNSWSVDGLSTLTNGSFHICSTTHLTNFSMVQTPSKTIAASPAKSQPSGSSAGLIAGATIGAVVLVAIVVVGAIFIARRRVKIFSNIIIWLKKIIIFGIYSGTIN